MARAKVINAAGKTPIPSAESPASNAIATTTGTTICQTRAPPNIPDDPAVSTSLCVSFIIILPKYRHDSATVRRSISRIDQSFFRGRHVFVSETFYPISIRVGYRNHRRVRVIVEPFGDEGKRLSSHYPQGFQIVMRRLPHGTRILRAVFALECLTPPENFPVPKAQRSSARTISA